MKFLIDINHPAHVHLFKNFIKYLQSKKIDFLITSRDKEITNLLLKYEKFEYISLSKAGSSLIKMAFELLQRDISIFKLHYKHKFTHAIGTSVSIAHLSFVSGVKSYGFNEDDDEVVPLYTNITYPFLTKIINPDCIKFNKWKNKRILVPSYHELAYLHPNNFNPNLEIIKKYNLQPQNYVIVRLSALKAHHDVGMQGISKNMLIRIKELLKDYQIIESSELKKQYKIQPWDIHHVLAFAKMIISDSQTMTIEAAVLGVPAIRINTFIDKSTVISELEKKYMLCYGFYPYDEENIIKTINYLKTNNEINRIWSERRETMLKDKIDFNEWMINFFEKELSLN